MRRRNRLLRQKQKMECGKEEQKISHLQLRKGRDHDDKDWGPRKTEHNECVYMSP